MKPVSVLNVACILIVFCLLAVPAYPWSSLNGGNHLEIDKTAYEMLTKTTGFNSNNFPDIKSFGGRTSISNYEGIQNGADACDFKEYPKGNPYEDYKWSNHYYNPNANRGAGEGNAPNRAQYWYSELVNEIKAGKAKGPKAAQAAAYLGHYVADVGCPYHIMEKKISNPSPAHIDWYDPYYKEIKVQGKDVPTGYHPAWEALAHCFSCSPGPLSMSSEWESCKSKPAPIASFVKAIAYRTALNKEKWWHMSSDMAEPLRCSVQDVFTVYKAAYDEGTSQKRK